MTEEYKYDPNYICVGDPVQNSPVGPGKITGVTDAGYPQVNDIAVSVLIRGDGLVWNPHSLDMEQVLAQWAKVDAAIAEEREKQQN